MKRMLGEDKKVSVTIKIDPSSREAAITEAKRRGVSFSAVVRRSLDIGVAALKENRAVLGIDDLDEGERRGPVRASTTSSTPSFVRQQRVAVRR